MDEWFLDGPWEDDDDDSGLGDYDVAESLANLFFLSENDVYPDDTAYEIGYLTANEWLPLVRQLRGMVDWSVVIDRALAIEPLLTLSGLPTEILEAPLEFLEAALDGHLPRAPSGRKVDARRLVKIAREVVLLARELRDNERGMVQGWAAVHRSASISFDHEALDEDALADHMWAEDLPPPVAGFGMMMAMTLSRWPARAEGWPLPPQLLTPELYTELLAEWEALPDSPSVTEEGVGDAENLFAQGQLAHALAQMGSIEGLDPDGSDDGDGPLAYSRLSRAILWIHHQCRHCPERDGVACKVALMSVPERPEPLLDVAAQMSNAGRIKDCSRM